MSALLVLVQAAEDAGMIEATLATLEATSAIGLAGPYVVDAAALASAYAGAVTGSLIAAAGSSI